jgi:hypothetical protein
MWAQTRRTVVAATGSERHGVESLDGGSARGNEGDVRIAAAQTFAGAQKVGRSTP